MEFLKRFYVLVFNHDSFMEEFCNFIVDGFGLSHSGAEYFDYM